MRLRDGLIFTFAYIIYCLICSSLLSVFLFNFLRGAFIFFPLHFSFSLFNYVFLYLSFLFLFSFLANKPHAMNQSIDLLSINPHTLLFKPDLYRLSFSLFLSLLIFSIFKLSLSLSLSLSQFSPGLVFLFKQLIFLLVLSKWA